LSESLHRLKFALSVLITLQSCQLQYYLTQSEYNV